MKSLFRLFQGSGSLSPRWTYVPGSKIWRILPAEGGLLVGESRNDETKKVSFFCIDLKRGTARWSGRTVDENWWVGIETVYDGTLLLHLFARPDMPDHAGIIALDLVTGEPLWNEPMYRLRGVRDGKLFGTDSDSDEGLVSVLACRTGERVAVLPPDSPELVSVHPTASEPADVAYPEPVGEQSPEWSRFQPVITGKELVGSCESAEVDGRQIFSYHVARNTQLDPALCEHRITVIDRQGQRLYDDVLHRDAHMPVYDAFFVREGNLHYVRNERELVCVVLSNQGT